MSKEALPPAVQTAGSRQMADLPAKQIAELRHIAFHNKGASGIRRGAMAKAANPRAASSLHSKGLVRRMSQSEAARGERRIYYWLYELTDEGRAALAAIDRTGEAK